MDQDNSYPLTFQPIRNGLYSSKELMTGYDEDNFASMEKIPDFQAYVYFVKNGRALPSKPYAGMMQAIHDNSILQAMYRFINELGRPTAAIMGGHKEERGSAYYRAVLQLSKKLTENGFLMASGGGPGAMEATHLGACLAGQSENDVERAMQLLLTEPSLPNSMNILSDSGVLDMALLEKVHKWTKPAFHLMQEFDGPAESLAVPSWVYGHEPLTPLATHVAKYFQNSIREDVLLALATNGIVFAPGAAGTMQEVFQDAAQNYYHRPNEPFSPMVFYPKKFWQTDYPVEPLMKALFLNNNRREEYEAKVRFMDDVDQIVDFLLSQNPSHQKSLHRLSTRGLHHQMQEPLTDVSTPFGKR